MKNLSQEELTRIDGGVDLLGYIPGFADTFYSFFNGFFGGVADGGEAVIEQHS